MNCELFLFAVQCINKYRHLPLWIEKSVQTCLALREKMFHIAVEEFWHLLCCSFSLIGGFLCINLFKHLGPDFN